MPTPKKVSHIEKKCTVCKAIKPVSEFYKNPQRGDGYYTKCKKCHSKIVKKWQMENKERFRELCRNRKKAHSEESREYSKRWASKNYERKVMNAKRWRENNPEYGKIWRKNNLDKIRNYQDRRRARIAGNGGNLTVDEWNAILDFYGHKCLCCRKDNVKLTVDHVIPIFHGGTHTADNVQPLCGPCNSRKKDKHIDYRKEYFHETSRN